MATKRAAKNRLFEVENDEPITIRPSLLRQIIKDTLEEALKKCQKDEDSKADDKSDDKSDDKADSDADEESGDNVPSRDKLANMPAPQVKKLAEKKAADEKVTIRIAGKGKTPTKKDNINFLVGETPPVEEPSEKPEKSSKKAAEKPSKKVTEKKEKPSKKATAEKPSKKATVKKEEAVYDSQKRLYMIEKYATNEKGEVYGWVLKSGKVRPLSKDDRLDIRKRKLSLVVGSSVTTQGGVDKYRKSCEKKTDSDSSEESEEESTGSILSEIDSDSESEISSDED